jgi:hypothetical protein
VCRATNDPILDSAPTRPGCCGKGKRVSGSDDLIESIKSAEADRAIKQVAADQAGEHRDHLIRDAVDEGVDKTVVASAANLSAADVDNICNFR